MSKLNGNLPTINKNVQRVGGRHGAWACQASAKRRAKRPCSASFDVRLSPTFLFSYFMPEGLYGALSAAVKYNRRILWRIREKTSTGKGGDS